MDLKNDVVAHEASLKAAKTSYFKTDFVWALFNLIGIFLVDK
jgi:hypothetical protein